jgi:hypothetical protein
MVMAPAAVLFLPLRLALRNEDAQRDCEDDVIGGDYARAHCQRGKWRRRAEADGEVSGGAGLLRR